MNDNTNNPIESDIIENHNKQNYHLEFLGNGKEWFKIIIINWLLTVLTLGIYYPWARAKSLRYIYGKTVLNNEHFHFSGTGKEMFRGFIKVLLGYVLLGVLYIVLSSINAFLALVVIYLLFILIIPFAIHGSFKYKMSRTSYRGIRFGYRGERKEFVLSFFKWIFLSIITLGIYSYWMQMNVRKYTHENIRYGDVEFTNTSNGGDWFGVVKKGENYGWKILGWGGTNYTGTKIGPKWKPGFTQAIKYWVPSIAASSMVIYKGNEFQEWNGHALVTSLRDQSLRKIKFKANNFIKEDIIFKGNIGRIRDIEIQNTTGQIFLLTDQGSIWRLYK